MLQFVLGGVMVSVLASSAVDRGFELRLGQTKDYNIGICCFSAKHAAIRRKSTDWMALNPNNVSEWGDMSTRDCCFTLTITRPMRLILKKIYTEKKPYCNCNVRHCKIHLNGVDGCLGSHF
jgi:hypothetical protein